MVAEFGRLQKVAVSEGWGHEAKEFTPWLAENLDLLVEELGVRLSFVEREHDVGRFHLDLLLEDSQGRVAIIENQFGWTNHDHLGKLLTYAAGTDAELVIWLAESFHEEHLAAVDWLNENSPPGVGFFAVELELLRIADSPLAPHFRVVSRPNEWKKQARTETRQQIEWDWTSYASELEISEDKLAVGRELVQLLEEELDRRGVEWRTRFRKGYVSFQSPSSHRNFFTVYLAYFTDVRLQVKLPAPLDQLATADPFPALQSSWVASTQEVAWWVPSAEQARAGLRGFVDLALHLGSGEASTPVTGEAEAGVPVTCEPPSASDG